MKTIFYKTISKIILISIFLAVSSQCHAQLSLGEDENTVYNILYSQVSSHNRSANNNSRYNFDVRRWNGIVSEIIITVPDGYLYDLRLNSNYAVHYFMKDGILDHISTQYANISTAQLKKGFNTLYGERHIDNYYFSDNFKTYKTIYLANNGLSTVEERSQAVNPVPLNIQKQLSALRQQEQKELANENSPFDPTEAIDYSGFARQEDKVLYSVLNDIYLNQKVNNNLIATAGTSLKAVIAYYSSISNSSALTKTLNLGAMCSPELTAYISRYFNNSKEITSQVSQCQIRGIGKEYSLNRLEVSQFNGRITASFAMTYYKDGRSQDDVIGVDEFKVNPDQSISVINLSSKESAQKKSTRINSQVYDVQKTAPDTYEAFKFKLRAELIRVIRAGDKYIPSFQDFYDNIDKSNFNPSWSITRNYDIDWSTYYDDADYRKTEKHQTITNDKDVNYWSLLWACKIDMPSITVNGVNVKYVTLTVNNIGVDFTKGISLAKIKDDEIEFNGKYVPTSKVIEKIKSKISGARYKGDYLITYELGKVLNEDYENINFEKIKNNTYKTPAGWVIKL